MVSRERIAVESEDRVQLVDLIVEPLPDTEEDPLFLVVFTDVGAPVTRRRRRARPGGGVGRWRLAWRSSTASCAIPASGCNR